MDEASDADPARLARLATYAPGPLRRRVAVDPSMPSAARRDDAHGAVMLVDIAGFTALAEQAAARGGEGAETLTRVINECFGHLSRAIAAWGGESLCFPGDAVLALWRADDAASLGRAAGAAARCGLALQSNFPALEIYGAQLKLRVTVCAGRASLATVGGDAGRWEFFALGDAVAQLAQATAVTPSGAVVLSPEARAALPGAVGRDLAGGAMALASLPHEAPRAREPYPPVGARAEPALRCFVPDVVQRRLDAGLPDWLAELRQVTVSFVEIRLPLDGDGWLAALHDAVGALQAVVRQYGGSVSQLTHDDKGLVLLSAWGLPDHTHEDDATRATAATLRMLDALAARGVGASAGIATGRAFCGERGAGDHLEYAMIGSVVNLAARLMKLADSALCDGPTALAASRVTFDALSPARVKGRAEPVPVFRPRAEAVAPLSARASPLRDAAPDGDLVGREVERERLRGMLAGLTSAAPSRPVVIEGEAGIGKSMLVRTVVADARAAGVRLLVGAGDAIEHSTPWFAWRPIFAELLDIDGGLAPELRVRRALQALAPHPEMVPWAPLLGAVLPIDLPENEVTSQMPGTVRGEATRELLLTLLRGAAARAPLAVVLDDAHWIDSVSLGLALAASRKARGLLVVLLSRPPTEAVDPTYDELRSAAGDRLLRLDQLDPAQVADLLRRRLGVRSLPPELVAFVFARAEGHPFYSEEIAYALRDHGLLVVEGDECRLAPHADDLSVSFPDTVQGVIAGRIDRLDPHQQLTLKVASVIGRFFALRLLGDVHPVGSDHADLDAQLDALVRTELTARDEAAQDAAHLFKHIITRDVAYNLLLPSQRAQLHLQIARWYQRRAEAGDESLYGLLAHHFGLAGDVDREVDYLERAGQQAVRKGAAREVMRFFNRALKLAGGRGAGDLRTLLWHKHVGDAHHYLSEYDLAEAHYDLALALVGDALPRGRAGNASRLAREAARQLAHQTAPSRLWRVDDPGRRAALEVCIDVTTSAAEIRYFRFDIEGWAACSLMAINLAEATGNRAAATRAYGGFGFIMHTMRFRSLANRWFETGETAAPDARASVVNDVGRACSHLVDGRFDDSIATFGRCLALAQSVGDNYGIALARVGVTQPLQLSGDYARAIANARALASGALAAGSASQAMWGQSHVALMLAWLGRLEEAAEETAAAEAMLPGADDVGRFNYWGARAMLSLRTGDEAGALDAVSSLLRRLETNPMPNFTAALPYGAVTTACQTLWQRARERRAPEASALAASSATMLGHLSTIARIYPMTRPLAAWRRGHDHWIRGNPRRAVGHWRDAVELSKKYNTRHDLGLAQLELALHGPAAERDAHRAEALAHLGAVGDTHHLAALSAT